MPIRKETAHSKHRREPKTELGTKNIGFNNRTLNVEGGNLVFDLLLLAKN